MNSIKKTDHFYLIDGSGYIFRAYYALPPLSRKIDGLPTGAVSGFCSMLFKLLEESRNDESDNRPTHFAVIFDSARKNFRNDIYKEYKANRSEAPEDLIPQFEYIRKSVKAFNLPSIELINYEADDLIATYVKKIIESGAKVTVISSDKDLMQLVSDNIRLYDPMKSKVLGEKEVFEKFGVKPNQVIDVQSLAGDSSDNIPGVPGIGIKTASELIKKYKTLDTLLNKADEIPQNKRRETLLANKDKAILSRKLVTLKNDVPVKDDLDSFILKDIEKEKLYDFLREMEFNKLLSRAIGFYGETGNNKIKSVSHKVYSDKINVKVYESIINEKELDKWLKVLKEQSIIAVDTETSSLNPLEADLIGISFSYAPNKACYIPLAHKNIKGLKKEIVLKKIKPILEDPSIKKVGQNIKFDFLILSQNNIEIKSLEDTMLISYTLDAGTNRHNLDTLSEIHLNHKTISYKELVGTGKNKLSFSDITLDKATEYAAEDADVTLRLYNYLKTRLDDEKFILLEGCVDRISLIHRFAAALDCDGTIANTSTSAKLPASAALPMMGLSAREHQLTRKGVFQGLSIPWSSSALDSLVVCSAGAQFVVSNPFENSELPKNSKGISDFVENWLSELDSEIRGLLIEIGEDGIDQLNRKHLRALDSDTANMTGIRLAGYDRPMPQWLGQ